MTPKAPVHVTLHPKIQPAPEPCPIFFPTLNEPLKLSQSAYWVLRLPYPFICFKITVIFNIYYDYVRGNPY